MGNICRSPAAEGVMRHLVKAAACADAWDIDSAGTIGLHAGDSPDSRMTRAARDRGIPLEGRARQYRPADPAKFDLILAMDRDNYQDIQGQGHDHVRLFCEFCRKHGETEVPDPYYGGEAGFERVLDLLEDGCAEILRQWEAGELQPVKP